MITTHPRQNRESLLKVRVKAETKDRVIRASQVLDIDQSSLIRLALAEYITRHCPHAA